MAAPASVVITDAVTMFDFLSNGLIRHKCMTMPIRNMAKTVSGKPPKCPRAECIIMRNLPTDISPNGNERTMGKIEYAQRGPYNCQA